MAAPPVPVDSTGAMGLVGIAPEPTIVGVEELFFETGDVYYDEDTETRIRTWIVYTKNGSLLYPANFAGGAGGIIPPIGSSWGEDSIGPLGPRSPLTLKDARITQMTPQSVRVELFYSTDILRFCLRRRIALESDQETLLYDLDATEGPVGIPPSAGCLRYQDLASPSPQDALANGKDGIPTLVTRATLIISGLFWRLPIANMTASHNTTNGNTTPDFPEANTWLFLGSYGNETRPGVWDMEMRFAYDPGYHRFYGYQREYHGLDDDPEVDPNTNQIRCRSVRRFRSRSWADWLPAGPFNQECAQL